MRISVDLPQPEGPISAAVSPSRSVNERSRMISTSPPAAARALFRATWTSSCAGAPARDMTFEGLDEEALDGEHQRGEGERVGEQGRDIKQLKGRADLEPDAVRPSEQLDDQHDLPD